MNPQNVSSSFLIATGHIRAMRGGAQSHMLTARDGHAYMVKFANNPQSVRVLANEWLASSIGRALGLKTCKSSQGHSHWTSGYATVTAGRSCFAGENQTGTSALISLTSATALTPKNGISRTRQHAGFMPAGASITTCPDGSRSSPG